MILRFFWHDIGSDISSQAHTVFQHALEKVRKLIDQGVV
ncbi:hypothetical protein VPBB_1397 [Vibrio parahaemolyticus BB22OP]|nr:hypothetical protein VPBB_1397 [Vibrio parahaemolyticus BB22OP]